MDKETKTLMKSVYQKVAVGFTQDDLIHIADEMQHGGHGGFIQALGLALQRADLGNQRTIVQGVGEKFNFQYYLDRWETANPHYFVGLKIIYDRENPTPVAA